MKNGIGSKTVACPCLAWLEGPSLDASSFKAESALRSLSESCLSCLGTDRGERTRSSRTELVVLTVLLRSSGPRVCPVQRPAKTGYEIQIKEKSETFQVVKLLERPPYGKCYLGCSWFLKEKF